MNSNNKSHEISININDINHYGRQKLLVAIAPNGKYVITYNKEDHSFEGWIVSTEDSKWISLKRDPEVTVCKLPYDEKLNEIKVNDDKVVLYVCKQNIKTLHMSKKQPIKPRSLRKIRY
ncbi:4427_t:CDS:1, partial [Funneliformis mosseae]